MQCVCHSSSQLAFCSFTNLVKSSLGNFSAVFLLVKLLLKYVLGCYWIPRICWKSWTSWTYCKSIDISVIDVYYNSVIEHLNKIV